MVTTTPGRFGITTRDGVVAIEVGLERTKYFVHKALLEEHSEYFKKALSGPWKEAEDKVVCLDDVDCRTFEVFVEWLYTRMLPLYDFEWNQEELSDDKTLRSQWRTTSQINMLKAYAFADRMLSLDLHRALEHQIIDHFIYNAPLYGTVIYAFAHLAENSSILKVMIDAHCREFDEKMNSDEDDELLLRTQLPNAFLHGVMLRYSKLNAEKDRKLREYGVTKYKKDLRKCDYHRHATKEERMECRGYTFAESDISDFD